MKILQKAILPLRHICFEYLYRQKALRVHPAETRLTVYRWSRVIWGRSEQVKDFR